MVHLIGNEAAWEIDHRSNSLPRAADWLLFTSELKNGVHGHRSEDEVAEFLTKTARDKCKNTQNISLVDNVLLDLHNSFHPTQPHSLIAKYVTTEHSKIALVCCLALARWQLNNIVIFCFPQFDFLSNIAFSM